MIILINVFSQIDSLSDVRVFALARSDEHLFHGLNQEHQVGLRRFSEEWSLRWTRKYS